MGIQSRYYWKAEYENGSVLKQYDSNGEERNFNEIDQDRLDTFSWISDDNVLPTYTIDLKDWQRLIAFRRHVLRRGNDRVMVYALGWQATINGRNYKTINYILPDGSVIMGEEL